jgi:starch synthase
LLRPVGLGEVVSGLSRELEFRGHAVEIVLPKYDCLRYDRIDGLTVDYEDLWVPWYGGAVHCTVFFGFVEGRECFFIEAPRRSGSLTAASCMDPRMT